MTGDIKQALYVAETARRMGHESLTKEQMCEALVALAEEHERLTDARAEAEVGRRQDDGTDHS